jgi:hypothetical protein
MLLKGFTRTVAIVGPILFLIFLFTISAFRDVAKVPGSQTLWKWNVTDKATDDSRRRQQDSMTLSAYDAEIAQTHVLLSSVTTKDKKYFPIEFGSRKAINPNIIPHPSLEDTWIIIAMQEQSDMKNSIFFAELVCNARFVNDKLSCIEPPLLMPIAATEGDKCTGELSFFANNLGPHDARVFYGPKAPYTIYGSNSKFTCFGQWMQDFRMLTDWGYEPYVQGKFRKATELQRPAPWHPVEKNWFIFWDSEGKMYTHYDISPKRVFAELQFDGSVGPDLGLQAAEKDAVCMERFMPEIGPELESIHQASNSLSITMCKRSDPDCKPDETNTFILTIFQHKTFYAYHSVYEPYLMLFDHNAPFDIHAISRKPIWINGRGRPGEVIPYAMSDKDAKTWNQTEMFYVTSISWKKHGEKYHGYLDDIIFIAFGIEDMATGGIDVVAEDLMQSLNFCED